MSKEDMNMTDMIDMANAMSSRPKVNPFEYDTIKCDECGSENFTPVMQFRKIPGLLVGEKENILYPHKVFICRNCGALSPMSKEEIEEITKLFKKEKKSDLII